MSNVNISRIVPFRYPQLRTTDMALIPRRRTVTLAVVAVLIVGALSAVDKDDEPDSND